MPIHRRFNRPKKLRYHQQFGLITNPPFGVRGGTTLSCYEGVAFGPEYIREKHSWVPKDCLKAYEDTDERHRIAGEVYGNSLWPDDDIVTYLASDVVGLERKLVKIKEAQFIAGWVYDRCMYRNSHGIGPGSTYAAWVATKVGYQKRCEYFPHQPRTYIVNPYLDWEYVGDYTSKKLAVQAIETAYEKKHDILV